MLTAQSKKLKYNFILGINSFLIVGHLYAFKNACWYDFDRQIKSMESLLDYKFEYILPGHGGPFHADKKLMKQSLIKYIEWMKQS
jgi:glyoxylase-like metal-dependent hydrolase (beta-lactamase superfamily II)